MRTLRRFLIAGFLVVAPFTVLSTAKAEATSCYSDIPGGCYLLDKVICTASTKGKPCL
jgi:hypothetical protein